ncbi:MAG TPA: prepilin-type N-terminal cleavage/methylation domain-containing protein [Verrucomicrobiae bacterium]|nr:prepilin-type N-terminal cleavage/methylation domain-containing protein [Verrucomicrobiae bacterium]
MHTLQKRTTGFTVIELLAVVVVLALVASAGLPALARTKASVQRLNCTDNLKRISVAFQSWSSSHSELYPMRVSASNGGYADLIGQRIVSQTQSTARGVFGIFMVLSNELSSPHVLICPAENEIRLAATTFANTLPPGATNVVPFTNDLNTSYFVGVDTTPSSPAMFLSGDHNMGADWNLIPLRGFVTAPSSYAPDFKVMLGTNFAANAGPGWLDTMHAKRGNVVLGDCSVQQLDRGHLQALLQISGDPGAAANGPLFLHPTGCQGFSNRLQFP